MRRCVCPSSLLAACSDSNPASACRRTAASTVRKSMSPGAAGTARSFRPWCRRPAAAASTSGSVHERISPIAAEWSAEPKRAATAR